MWEKRKKILKKWWFWVLSITAIIGISYALYEWRTNPQDIVELTVSAVTGLAAFVADVLAIKNELTKEQKSKISIKNKYVDKSETQLTQKGNHNLQFKEAEFLGPTTFDFRHNETHNYPTQAQTSELKFNDSYSPPTPPPSNQLPDPGPLSPGSHLPFIEDINFTGRENDLLEIAKRLLYTGEHKPVLVIHGMGGKGKSHLAIRFCQVYGRFFKGVHWLNAKEDFNAGVATCGEKMAITPWTENIPEQAKLTLTAWEKSTPRLVVLDDIPDPQALQQWMTELPDVRLLVTSRCDRWPPGLPINLLNLSLMEPDEALAYLHKLSPRFSDDDPDLSILAEHLGYLPLALYLAGCYLNDRTHLSVNDYLQALKEAESLINAKAFQDWTEYSPSDHPNSLFATFMTSWEALEEKNEGKLARMLFLACGYCQPGVPIPLELLYKIKEGETNPESVDLALRALGEAGLIEESKNGTLIHPLVSDFARYKDVDLRALTNLAEIYGPLSNEINNTGLPKRITPHFPHLRNLAEWAEKEHLDKAGVLWNNCGYAKRILGDYTAAKAHFERALKIDRQAYDPDHPTVAIRLNNLGSVLKDLGDLQAAKAHYERALKIDRQAYGPDHPTVATVLNNLGLVLEDLGDLQAARDHFERALKIDQQAYGPDHPTVATVLNNLGLVLKDLGDLQAAKDHFERALTILIDKLPPEHPHIKLVRQNLEAVNKQLSSKE